MTVGREPDAGPEGWDSTSTSPARPASHDPMAGAGASISEVTSASARSATRRITSGNLRRADAVRKIRPRRSRVGPEAAQLPFTLMWKWWWWNWNHPRPSSVTS